MGICDYTDFIQRNNQCLYTFNASYDEEGCGNTECILVMVPDTYTKREILQFRLTKFAEFSYILAGYSWDSREFTTKKLYLKEDGKTIVASVITNNDNNEDEDNEIKDYEEALDNNDWWDRSIWSSSSYPGYLLVNFDPEAYSAFVLQKLKAKDLHKFYIKTVFGNRPPYRNGMGNKNIVRGISKDIIYEKIVDSAKENLFEYDKIPSLKFDLPDNYTNLVAKLRNHSVLNQTYVYRFKTPQGLSKARLTVLIHDNIKVNHILKAKTDQYQMLHYDTDRSDIRINFMFALDTNVPESYLQRCCHYDTNDTTKKNRRCKNMRYIGNYYCLNHINSNNLNVEKAKVERQISRYCNKHLIPNLERMDEILLPENIVVKFTERGIDYIINLEYKAIHNNDTQKEKRLGLRY